MYRARQSCRSLVQMDLVALPPCRWTVGQHEAGAAMVFVQCSSEAAFFIEALEDAGVQAAVPNDESRGSSESSGRQQEAACCCNHGFSL